MAFRALSLLLALASIQALVACSISGVLPDWQSEDVAGPEPAYRFIIANGLSDIIGPPSLAGTLAISGVRRVSSLKGAAWVACLKTQHLPLPPRHYAVFIQRGRIVNSRLSVVIDQCELQTYAPFNWAADATSPPL